MSEARRLVLLIAGLIFCVVWLYPFFSTGAMLGTPIRVYRRLEFQYSAAALFTRRIERWNQPVFQVQTEYSADWKTLNTSELSPMGAFGFRQRLDRILLDTNGKRTADQVRRRLADWIAAAYSTKHPDEGGVTGVRMGSISTPSNSPELASPPGRWEPDQQPVSAFRAYASFAIKQGKAIPVQAGKSNNPIAPLRTPSVFERK